MDKDTQELLERILKLEEENNKMLRKIRSSARWSAVFSFIYWAVIIGSTAAAYLYLQPILLQLLETYQTIATTAQKAGSALDPKMLQDLTNTIKKLSP